MSKYIIITSIFPPTEAVRKFAQFQNYHLVVVGDKKSPLQYEVDNTTFFGVNNLQGYNLEKVLPYNHYCRKMLGYVYAIKHNADIIADSDDDNIPYDNWGCLDFEGEYLTVKKSGFINVYEYFTDKKIWPRGLPLQHINQTTLSGDWKTLKYQHVGIWQGLADKSPDVDAIYRLVNDGECFFDKKAPLVLDEGSYCPFNSQNTFFRKDLFALMYLPATVTFRFTDILRGLVAQPIAQLYGYKLGFFNATVIQERNIHNYFKDFQSEVPMYLNSEEVINIVLQTINKEKTLADNLYQSYEALYRHGIVEAKELEILRAWLDDIR